MDKTDSEKRKRLPNYSEEEIRILMRLVFEHAEIIENKKVDNETNKLKQNVWRVISESFSRNPRCVERPPENLRQKYDSIKKLTRKKMLRNEEHARGNTKFIHLEDYEKALKPFLDYTYGTNELDSSVEECNGISPDIPEFLRIKVDPADSDEDSVNASRLTTNTEELNDRVNPPMNSQRTVERFSLVDEDMLWDLPDHFARPRLQFIKKRQELMDREEERRDKEHRSLMENLKLEKIMLRNKERRLRAEHRKRMELLDLQLQVERDKLEQNGISHKN